MRRSERRVLWKNYRNAKSASTTSRTNDTNDATISTKAVIDLHYTTFYMILSPHFLDFL